jgi:single-stranded-DNA-specific exonuclease
MKKLHLKFYVKQNDEDEAMEAIGFGHAEYYDLIASGMRFSLAYYLEENNYLGNKTLQLRVKDIRFE